MITRTMRLEGDAARAERTLNAVPFVSATVDRSRGIAVVHAEPQVDPAALRAAAEDAGCRVVSME